MATRKQYLEVAKRAVADALGVTPTELEEVRINASTAATVISNTLYNYIEGPNVGAGEVVGDTNDTPREESKSAGA